MGRISALVGLALVLLLLPALALANAAQMSFSGAVATEPVGLDDVAIARETLAIDLRPLADGEPAKVTARYVLRNDGAQRRLDLVFAGGSSIAALRVHLDGTLVPTRVVPADPPESWQPPRDVPSIGGGRRAYYADPSSELPAFAIDLPAGEHELVVEYDGVAAHERNCEPTICWQFAYVLGPARAWAGFGGLDATILVPAGWEIAVEPAFERTGDELHASFDDVPSDAIGLSTRAPAMPMRTPVVIGTWLLFAVVVVAGGWACLRAGRHLLAAIAAVLVWPFAIAYTGIATVSWPRLLVPASQAPTAGYDDLWGLFVAFLAFPIGIVLTLVGARRRARELAR